MRDASVVVVHTGAGLSTAAGERAVIPAGAVKHACGPMTLERAACESCEYTCRAVAKCIKNYEVNINMRVTFGGSDVKAMSLGSVPFFCSIALDK